VRDHPVVRDHPRMIETALDLADFGITVHAIPPGPIETELMLGVWSAEALQERPSTERSPGSGLST